MPSTTVPLDVVGSNNLGNAPGVSSEETINMYISDKSLISFPGYKKLLEITPGTTDYTRAFFVSKRANIAIMVIGSEVYKITDQLVATIVGNLETTTSRGVFIAENNANQIAISDYKDIFIYREDTGVFAKATTSPGTTIDFNPGYITFQNGYFICADTQITSQGARWRLSTELDGTTWPNDSQHVGALQTKPDITQACVAAPGKGNMLYVMGQIVTELWTDVGDELFPYVRSTTQSIDYGVVNAKTIAVIEEWMCWLGQNENTGPVILFSNGGQIQQISDAGINRRLSQINDLDSAVGMFYKQDGHIFYQITFYNPKDNFTIAYDFSNGTSYTLMNEMRDAHIAMNVQIFNERYFFASFKDSNLYEMNTNFTTFDYGIGQDYVIPRIRVTSTLRLDDGAPFIANEVMLNIIQGTDYRINSISPATYQPVIALSLSRNSGQSFGSKVSVPFNALGNYQNRVTWRSLGRANALICQFEFLTRDSVIVNGGSIRWYQ